MARVSLAAIGLLVYALGSLVAMAIVYAISGNPQFYETHRYVPFSISTSASLIAVVLLTIGFDGYGGWVEAVSFAGAMLFLVSQLVCFLIALSGYVSFIYGANSPLDLVILPIPGINVERITSMTTASAVIGLLGLLMVAISLFRVSRVGLVKYGSMLVIASVLAQYITPLVVQVQQPWVLVLVLLALATGALVSFMGLRAGVHVG